jgi:outer membrane protein assembly factor BamB
MLPPRSIPFMKTLSTLLLLCSALCLPGTAADWSQFRGPTGDGHYAGPKLPVEIGPDANVAWKVEIPGKGWSSPVVWKGKTYLTTAVAQANGDQSLRAIAVDAAGKIEWNVEVFPQEAASAPKIHGKNSHASPTPTTDGERLYVHFGHMGTAALDFQGKIVWKREKLYAKPVHGNGGSPILVDGKLIFSVDAIDGQYVLALDPKTGKDLWKTERKSSPSRPFSFATPHVIEQDGKPLVISAGSDVVMALNPADGKEVWRSKYKGYSLIQRPVAGNGMIYISTSYDTPNLLAIKLGGTGDVTESNAGWSVKKAVPNTPSFMLDKNELYMVADNGTMTCLDAKTGDQIWQERLKGGYSSSPILADGKIYVASETGLLTVVEASRTFAKVHEADFKEKIFASFAGVDGALYVRTETKLFKFAAK